MSENMNQNINQFELQSSLQANISHIVEFVTSKMKWNLWEKPNIFNINIDENVLGYGRWLAGVGMRERGIKIA